MNSRRPRWTKLFAWYFVENDDCLVASSRRDGLAYVSRTVQKARARREWVSSAPKETIDGRTLWEIIGPLFAPEDVVKMVTAAKEWNKGNTVRETFLLLVADGSEQESRGRH